MSRLLCCLILMLLLGGEVHAQENPFDAELLSDVRRAAGMIPGAPPTSVNVLKVAIVPAPPSYVIEGYRDTFVEIVHTMFQIRYPDGWITVDVSFDEESLGEGVSAEGYAQSTEALLGANLIITTHEHHDHLWRLIVGPNAPRYAERALLTREQIHTLMTAPTRPEVGLTAEQAGKFLTVGYDRIFPLAPGVVLIKAPGHLPGGQLVYVRSEEGREIILSGDVVWQKVGIDLGLQKPEEVSARMGEDREAIAQQIEWLRAVEDEGVAVVVFHDLADIDRLIEAGALREGGEFH